MAKDQATRQVWWEDEAFLTHAADDNQTDLSRKDFQRGTELYFGESDIFYQTLAPHLPFIIALSKSKVYPDMVGITRQNS